MTVKFERTMYFGSFFVKSTVFLLKGNLRIEIHVLNRNGKYWVYGVEPCDSQPGGA